MRMDRCEINPRCITDSLSGHQTGDKMRSSTAVANGIVYVGSDDGYLYAFGSLNAQTAPSDNITAEDSSPTSSQNSEPASSSEPPLASPHDLTSTPQTTPPPKVMPDPITVSTNAATLSLLGIVLGIVIVGTPFAVVISACLLFYSKKRKH